MIAWQLLQVYAQALIQFDIHVYKLNDTENENYKVCRGEKWIQSLFMTSYPKSFNPNVLLGENTGEWFGNKPQL